MLLVVRPKESMPRRTWPSSIPGAPVSSKRVVSKPSLRTWKSMPGAYSASEPRNGPGPERRAALRRQERAIGSVVEREPVAAGQGCEPEGGGDGALCEVRLLDRLDDTLGRDLRSVELGLRHQ